MKPHKWAKEIKHWADGGEIEALKAGIWFTTDYPAWDGGEYQFRIKPQPKEPQYLYVYKMMTNHGLEIQFWDSLTYKENLIGKIKLEADDAE